MELQNYMYGHGCKKTRQQQADRAWLSVGLLACQTCCGTAACHGMWMCSEGFRGENDTEMNCCGGTAPRS